MKTSEIVRILKSSKRHDSGYSTIRMEEAQEAARHIEMLEAELKVARRVIRELNKEAA